MVCWKCGTQNRKGAKYCYRCYENLEKSSKRKDKKIDYGEITDRQTQKQNNNNDHIETTTTQELRSYNEPDTSVVSTPKADAAAIPVEQKRSDVREVPVEQKKPDVPAAPLEQNKPKVSETPTEQKKPDVPVEISETKPAAKTEPIPVYNAPTSNADDVNPDKKETVSSVSVHPVQQTIPEVIVPEVDAPKLSFGSEKKEPPKTKPSYVIKVDKIKDDDSEPHATEQTAKNHAPANDKTERDAEIDTSELAAEERIASGNPATMFEPKKEPDVEKTKTAEDTGDLRRTDTGTTEETVDVRQASATEPPRVEPSETAQETSDVVKQEPVTAEEIPSINTEELKHTSKPEETTPIESAPVATVTNSESEIRDDFNTEETSVRPTAPVSNDDSFLSSSDWNHSDSEEEDSAHDAHTNYNEYDEYDNYDDYDENDDFPDEYTDDQTDGSDVTDNKEIETISPKHAYSDDDGKKDKKKKPDTGKSSKKKKPEQQKKKSKPETSKKNDNFGDDSHSTVSQPQKKKRDDGYDGYYDDVLPEDYGNDYVFEGFDSELIKKVALIAGGGLLVIIVMIFVMFYFN